MKRGVCWKQEIDVESPGNIIYFIFNVVVMDDGDSQPSWKEIPARMLNVSERLLLCSMLDERLIRETHRTSLPRDFRGLGELMRFDANVIREAEEKGRPTEELLFMWEGKEENTIGKLLEMFETLERYDVIDNLTPLLVKRRREIIRRYSSSESAKDSGMGLSVSSSHQMEIVCRKEWGALPARELQPLVSPVKYVVVHHTGVCKNKELHAVMKELQEYCMTVKGSFDIAYNFVIDLQGTVLEGTGWEIVCGHPFRYGRISLSVGLLGDFNHEIPSQIMMDTLMNLIELAVELGYLDNDYGLYAENDLEICSESPGSHVVDIISQWPRYKASGEIRDLAKFNQGLSQSLRVTLSPDKSEDSISWNDIFNKINITEIENR